MRASEERLRLALETTGLGIWDADLVSGRRQWTSEARDILGIPADAPTTRETFLDRVHPDDRGRVGATFVVDLPAEGPRYADTCRIVRADNGDKRWVAVTGRTFLDDDGRPVRKIGTIRDVTSRKRAEEALRASEERLRLALHASRMIAWEQDLATGFVTRSRNALELLGIGSAPLSEFLDNVHPEDRRLRDGFLRDAAVGESSSIEFRYVLPNGTVLWMGARGERSDPDRIVGVTFDISDR
ncbi:PAS domain-containing protein [Microvirga sp. 0TCS3.31]